VKKRRNLTDSKANSKSVTSLISTYCYNLYTELCQNTRKKIKKPLRKCFSYSIMNFSKLFWVILNFFTDSDFGSSNWVLFFNYDYLTIFYDRFHKLTYDYLKKMLRNLNSWTYDNRMTGLRIILRFLNFFVNRAPGQYKEFNDTDSSKEWVQQCNPYLMKCSLFACWFSHYRFTVLFTRTGYRNTGLLINVQLVYEILSFHAATLCDPDSKKLNPCKLALAFSDRHQTSIYKPIY